MLGACLGMHRGASTVFKLVRGRSARAARVTRDPHCHAAGARPSTAMQVAACTPGCGARAPWSLAIWSRASITRRASRCDAATQGKQVAIPRVPLPLPAGANDRWSTDLLVDALGDGRKFRALSIVDDYMRGMSGDRSRLLSLDQWRTGAASRRLDSRTPTSWR